MFDFVGPVIVPQHVTCESHGLGFPLFDLVLRTRDCCAPIRPCSRCWGFDGSLPTIPSATGSSVLGRDKITDSTRRCGPGRWSDCQSGKGATAWTWIPRC